MAASGFSYFGFIEFTLVISSHFAFRTPSKHLLPVPKHPRPPPNPIVLKPIVSNATFPVRIIKSAQEIF